ncbi:MAG: SpoIID/LytB domain-containing protein [Candidatus Zixiibacteriota bacterium]|nr:MAG: SpoIID/LytB domain-containing protein [candidate division Zixibacteria bacterium]
MRLDSRLANIVKFAGRLGTAVCLMVLVWSCATVPGLKDEATGNVIRVPFVRVLIEDSQAETLIGAEASFAIECLSQGIQTVYYSSRPVVVKTDGLLLSVENHKGGEIQTRVDEVNIIPRGNNNRIVLDGRRYRGIMKIVPNSQAIQIINIVYIEDYLRGVVPPEIGERADNELEAVKAQAVAARTYAMAHLQQYRGEPYDMKSSIIDQVYEGVKVEDRLVNKAIDLTAGSVLFYRDQYVNAYYHSTCGGLTDDISSVWDRKDIPYLKSVSDDGACSWSKYFNWKEVFTEPQLRGRVEQYLSSDRGRELRLGKIRNINIMERTPGGRIAKLSIETEIDVFRFFKDRIRWVVGRTSNPDLILPSARFEVDIERDSQGEVLSIVFRGSGYGHGVGMCQCGAIGLSREGWTYDDILAHYYSGTEIKKLY